MKDFLKKHRWSIALVTVLGISIVTTYAALRISTNDPTSDFLSFEFVKPSPDGLENTKPSSESDLLAIVLHAFNTDQKNMEDIVNELFELYGDSVSVIAPQYRSDKLTNTDLNRLSANLNEKIQATVNRYDSQYKSVVLVGHSLGALIARRAYLFGNGCLSGYPETKPKEMPLHDSFNKRPKTSGEFCGDLDYRDTFNWVKLTEKGRIVLLAGMNNGWTNSPRPRDMRQSTWLGFTVGDIFGTITGTGKMIRQAKRGTPFVAGIRNDWIKFIRSHPSCFSDVKGVCPVANVVQILGDNDDIVSQADSMDLMTTHGFVFMETLGTTHLNIVDFTAPPNRKSAIDVFSNSEFYEARREKFREAMSINDFPDREHKILTQRRGKGAEKVNHVVLVAHGIRDIGEWTSYFKFKYESDNVKVIPVRYGYFGMVEFFFSYFDRQEFVRSFVEQYINARAYYPWLEKISFVGHSNGTYLLASALRQYPFTQFDNVYFAGSVVPKDYQWQSYLGTRVSRLRNDTAKGDWVVALLPRFYEVVRTVPLLGDVPLFDLGSGGYVGFDIDESPMFIQKHGLVGKHSAAFESEDNVETIKEFILNENPQTQVELAEKQTPVAVDKLHFFWRHAWGLWVFGIAVVIAIGMGFGFLAARLPNTRTIVGVGTFVVYLVALFWGLNLV